MRRRRRRRRRRRFSTSSLILPPSVSMNSFRLGLWAERCLLILMMLAWASGSATSSPLRLIGCGCRTRSISHSPISRRLIPYLKFQFNSFHFSFVIDEGSAIVIPVVAEPHCVSEPHCALGFARSGSTTMCKGCRTSFAFRDGPLGFCNHLVMGCRTLLRFGNPIALRDSPGRVPQLPRVGLRNPVAFRNPIALRDSPARVPQLPRVGLRNPVAFGMG